MIDSYAYLLLEVVCEDPSQYPLKQATSINWKRFSSLTYRYFLSLAVLLAVLSVCKSAAAQVIREGDRGAEVSAIQRTLQSLGFFNSNVTGFFGPITRDAVIRFQQANGLSADGVVGLSTLAALGLNPPQNPPLTPISRAVIGLGQGDSGPGVSDLQTRLRQLGFFNTEPTGVFGTITRDAVIRFQQANGIPATGIVSEETLVFLNNRVAIAPGGPVTPILPLPSGVLQQGDSGPAVGVLQQRLFRLGFYDGEINNFFDARTQQAVIRFQQAYGIQPTGQVGPTTVSFLINVSGGGVPLSPTVPVVNSPVSLSLGDRGASVSLVQQKLQVLGYYNGPINGIFDLTTRQAVLAFQRDYGITQTGVVGPTTQSFLVRAVPQFQPAVVSQVPTSFVPQGQPLAVSPRPTSFVPQGQPLAVSPRPTSFVPQGQPLAVSPRSDGIPPQGRPLNPAPQLNPVNPQGRPTAIPELSADVIPQGIPLNPLTPIQPVGTYRSFVSVGDTGFEVRRVQQRLRELNFYRGPINGFFDRTTQDAVVRFQRANGITQTGVVGPTTRIYMFNSTRATASTPTTSASTQTSQTPSGIRTASVQELQKRLQVQGLYEGPVDGVYNSHMEVALNKAQELYGSSADDILFGGL